MTPAAPPARTDLTATLALFGLFRQSFAARVAEDPWLTDHGVKANAYGLLRFVDRFGPVSQREACDAVRVHPSEMVDLVDTAEQAGWCERRRDPTDRRRYQLTITAAGREVLDRLDEVSARTEAEVLAPLTEVERRTLLGLIAKVVDRP